MEPDYVFVVEDDPDILELVEHALLQRGYRVGCAMDGLEALERLRGADPAPDLVLLDLLLPGLHGLEVCKRLQADPATATLPIIIVSACGEEGDVVAGLDAGAVDYVTKPFGCRELCSRIARHLAQRRARRGLDIDGALLGGSATPDSTLVHADRLLSLGTLVAAINHEICNANTNVGGYANLLLRLASRAEASAPEFAAEVARLGARILCGSERIDRIIESVLNFARPPSQAGATGCVHTAFDVAVELTAARLRRAVREVRNEADPALCVAMSESELQQVFVNLLTNAGDAVQERRTAEPEHDGVVTLQAVRVRDEVWFEVHDNGVGMDGERRRRAFEPFYTTKKEGSGTGLGLGIVRLLVSRCGGTLECESSPGVGTAFRLRLPAARDATVPERPGTAVPTP